MIPSGSIQFRVFTSSANIPIPGATVIIRQQAPPFTLYGIQITDESGQTSILTIPTVAASLGQTPQDTEQPWTNLTAYIEHPAFEEAIFEGLQLFPGVLSIQNVQLIPNELVDRTQDDYQKYETTPQPLWRGGNP